MNRTLVALLLSISASAPALAADTDAKTCIDIELVRPKDGTPFHRITNTCSEKVGLVYCHEPSAQKGTRSTQCGENGRFYQQFVTLDAGKDTGNLFSTPADARVRYGACVGGEGRIKQTSGGDYVCR